MKGKNKSGFVVIIGISALILSLFLFKKQIKNKINGIRINYAKKNTCPCTNANLYLKFDNYRKAHLPRVKMYTFIKTENDLNKQIENGNLVPVYDSKGYKIRNLTHSSAYLHPKAYKILQELADRFQNRVKNKFNDESFFEISSLVRTSIQQKELAKKSRAATKGVSTHSYGLAFDIPVLKSKNCTESLIILQDLLNQMRSEGKIVLCPESGCIHVTVI